MADKNNAVQQKGRLSEDPDVLGFCKLQQSRDPKKTTKFGTLLVRDSSGIPTGLRILVSENGTVIVRRSGGDMAFH